MAKNQVVYCLKFNTSSLCISTSLGEKNNFGIRKAPEHFSHAPQKENSGLDIVSHSQMALSFYIVFCVGGSKQKECFIYHKVASVLYEK